MSRVEFSTGHRIADVANNTIDYVCQKIPPKYWPTLLVPLLAACGTRGEPPVSPDLLPTLPPAPEVVPLPQSSGADVELTESENAFVYTIHEPFYLQNTTDICPGIEAGGYDDYGYCAWQSPLLGMVDDRDHVHQFITSKEGDLAFIDNGDGINGESDIRIPPQTLQQIIADAATLDPYQIENGSSESEVLPLTPQEQPEDGEQDDSSQLQTESTLEPFTLDLMPIGPEGGGTEFQQSGDEEVEPLPTDMIISEDSTPTSGSELSIIETAMKIEFPGVRFNNNGNDVVDIDGIPRSRTDIKKALEGSITGGEGECSVEHVPPVGTEQSFIGECTREFELAELAAELKISREELKSASNIPDHDSELIPTVQPQEFLQDENQVPINELPLLQSTQEQEFIIVQTPVVTEPVQVRNDEIYDDSLRNIGILIIGAILSGTLAYGAYKLREHRANP